jgi:acyl carrier protein
VNQTEIFERITKCLELSCGIKSTDIALSKTLIDDLNIDSIDLIDLLYTIEKELNVSIKISEFQNFAESELGNKPFHQNNIVTAEGLVALKKIMPEVPADKIVEGLSVHKIPYLFTVESLCNVVERKLRSA